MSALRATVARLLFWRKPDATLQQFAETEAYGGRDLARAAEQVRDPWLRRQLILHAQDEVRHARLLEEGAEHPASIGLGASMLGESREASGVDMDEMGEVQFIAFVHLAEKRAVEEFKLHQAALADRGGVFESILQDEKRHVAWTGHALEKYRKAGRGAEVDAAIRRLRRERWWNVWLRISRRVSWVMSGLLLTLLYFVALLPFSLLAGRWRTGWCASESPRLDQQF